MKPPYDTNRPLSFTSCKELLRAPIHFVEYMNGRKKQTEAMIRGSFLHCAILTPDRVDQEFKVDKEGMPSPTAGLKSAPNFEYCKAKSTSRCRILPEKTFEEWTALAGSIRESLLGDQRFAHYLDPSLYQYEQMVEWVEPIKKTKMLSKIDGVPIKGAGRTKLFDLKFTSDASEKWLRNAWYDKYYMQAAMYCMAMKVPVSETDENGWGGFEFVVIETERPHASAQYLCTDMLLLAGMYEFEQAIRTLERCTKMGEWGGYNPMTMEGKWWYPPTLFNDLNQFDYHTAKTNYDRYRIE